uniref:4-diphosphocytidyl-2C-methyl-D-erythritol kinase n=1 Tax=Acidianus sulfidivorans JP7 TaxID=619593 RepID=A0A2U9IKQ3_9CREN
MRIGAVVLAAGEGKRFEGNKLLVQIKGKPVIKYVLNSLGNLERVVIVGKYAKELLDYLDNEVVIYNPYWNKGISTSIKLGIRFYSDYDGVLIVLGDMPLVTKNDIDNIISKFDDKCYAVIPEYNSTLGNPVLLSSKLFGKLMSIEGDQGAKQILRNIEEKEKIYTVKCGIGVITDVDTKEDVEKIEKIMMAEKY